MSFDDHNELQYSDGTPPEGVHSTVWNMLLSIKKDTAGATELADSLDPRLVILEDCHDHTGADIAKLKQAIAKVAKFNKILNGHLYQAEMTIERQCAEITDLRMRSMRDYA